MTPTTTLLPGGALPGGAVEIRARGLLSSVGRPCPEHGGECACVARHAEAGCLIYWCDAGWHHFSTRPLRAQPPPHR